MGFAGRFELTVPDILQILSLSRKTGKLTLSRLENSAELLFKNGMVIFATCDSTRHTLSNILISQKRLTESALMTALELQHLSSDNKRLGAILIEKGIITHRVLQEALRYQIEQVISELLTWENGFFRFDMIEIATDDGVTIDVGEFLGKAGMRPELLFLDGTHRLDDRREAERPRPEPVEGPPRPERVEGPRQLAPEPRPRPELVEGPARPRPEVLADLIEGQWQGERPPWIKSEASPSSAPDPTPTIRIEEPRQVEITPRPEPVERARPEPLDSARGKPVEGPSRPELVEGPARPERFHRAQSSAEPFGRMPRPEPVEEHVEGPRLAPEVPLRPAPAVTVRTPAPSVPTASTPPSQTSPAVPAAEAPQRVTQPAKEQQIFPSAAPSGTSPEGPLLDFEPSRITDEIMLSSPIAPWVLVMHLAADVVSRGVLLFVRSDGITGHDQFGVGGRESGDERIINIKIPWNEPSILAATIHARTSYRGKIGPGKWNDTFMGQLGGQRPNEALIIPIIVAGKVVAIFYGDDAGTGTPLGDVQRLQTLIGQTFSAVEASILEKRSKTSA